jgi:arsenite-transporting ATPase
VDAVIANKVFPPSDDPWMHKWASSQEEQMVRVRESFAPLPVFASEFADQEPVGEQDLRRLAERLYGEREAFQIAHATEPMKLRGKGDGYELEVALPLAAAKEVTLDRRSDDLVLQAGGYRRVIALPSALTRCDVVGARFQDDSLTVTFERDPRQWPARTLDTGSDLAGGVDD